LHIIIQVLLAAQLVLEKTFAILPMPLPVPGSLKPSLGLFFSAIRVKPFIKAEYMCRAGMMPSYENMFA